MISLSAEPELVQQYVEEDPHKPGPVEVRVRDHQIHVWALVGYLKGCDFDVARVARDYDIPEVYVEAALAYYRRHPEVIDARLEENAR